MKGFLLRSIPNSSHVFSQEKRWRSALQNAARKGKTVQREPRFIRINELTQQFGVVQEVNLLRMQQRNLCAYSFV